MKPLDPYDAFDLFPDAAAVEPTKADLELRAFTSLKRDAVVAIGSKVFLVFVDHGIAKYATAHGTKGRKFYKLIVSRVDPLTVQAFEVLQQVPERLNAKAYAEGAPRLNPR
jgi:hypothetical protein